MNVRKATVRDHADLTRFAFPFGDEDRERHLLADIEKDHCFVAEHEDKLLGFVVFDESFLRNTFIHLLVVHAEHRRQGIGTTLMRHVERISSTEKIFTSTNESNIPMQELCTSLGYVPSGQVGNLDPGDPELFYFKQAEPSE